MEFMTLIPIKIKKQKNLEELNYVIEYGTATYSDAVGVTSITNDAPETFPIGLTSITWTATDAAGNSVSEIQQIFIVDTTAPSITPPSNIVIEAQLMYNNTVTLVEAQATDAVSVDSITNDAPSLFSLGETIVTWTATDTSGNSANATQIVSVVDTTPPSILSVADITLEATSASENQVSLILPSAEDSISQVTITNDTPSLFSLGETIVTWTATDAAGNSASAAQTVSIVDTIPPTIIPNETITVEATSENQNIVELQVLIVEDAVGVSSINNDAPSLFQVGDTIVTWNATDAAGNYATITQTVSVVDTTAPKLNAPPAQTVEATSVLGNVIEYGTATYSDAVGVTSITNDAPETFPIGLTSITWTATDAGNSSFVTRHFPR